jgi:exportin-5
MLGLQNVGPYMRKNQAQKLEDWSAVPLDNEGKQIQETMTRKFQVLSLRLHSGPNFDTNSHSSNYL